MALVSSAVATADRNSAAMRLTICPGVKWWATAPSAAFKSPATVVVTWKITSTRSPSRRLVPLLSAVRLEVQSELQSGEHTWAICTLAGVMPTMVPAIAASTASSTVAPTGSVGNLVGEVEGDALGDEVGARDGDALGDEVDGRDVGTGEGLGVGVHDPFVLTKLASHLQPQHTHL